MKTIIKVLACMAILAAVAACRKSDPDPVISLESQLFEVDYGATELTIKVKTNVPDYTVNIQCEWITLLTKSSTEARIKLLQNEDMTARKGEILFYDGDELLSRAYVSQKGAPAKIEVGTNKYEISALGGTIDLQFSSNFEYELDIKDSWLSLSPSTKPVEITSITVYVQENTGSNRTGRIVIKEKATGKEFATVEVEQAAPVFKGFYFLNEGQWGKNNASLGYYDFSKASYTDGWWLAINPGVRGSLGDVGNDIAVSGNWLLAVINSSNLLEICDRDGKHLGEVEIPNGRMAIIDGDIAYVTSYADDGYVAKVDLAQKKVLATCKTGHEPEGLAIVDGKLYALNSCGYHTDYTGGGNNEESSISIIDLTTFKETEKVKLGVCNAYSPLTVLPDGKTFFINSSGDYNAVKPTSILFDTTEKKVSKNFGFGGTYADVYDGKLYIFDTSFSYTTFEWENSNCVYDPATGSIGAFPIDEEEFEVYGAPTGIWINQTNGDIYIADKGNYTSPAFLYRYDKAGQQKEKINVGVCPGHLAWDWR